MDIFAFQIAVLFVPGLIWERIDAAFGRHRILDHFDILRRSFLFGLAAHTATYFLFRERNQTFDFLVINPDQLFLTVRYLDEIGFSVCLALGLSLVWLYLEKHRVLRRLLTAVGAIANDGTR